MCRWQEELAGDVASRDRSAEMRGAEKIGSKAAITHL
jgi:hypothetical protein